MNEMTGPTSTSGEQTVAVQFDGGSTTWEHMAPQPKLTGGLIECFVGHANELILKPRTDLGASILAHLMHGEHEFAATLSGAPSCGPWGVGVEALTIKQIMPPMLSNGSDPFFSGLRLTADDYKAARALVDRLRRKRQQGRKA